MINFLYMPIKSYTIIIQPDGSFQTVAYSAGVGGYKIIPLELAVPKGLAPYPNELYGETDKDLFPITASPNLVDAKVYMHTHTNTHITSHS